MKKNNGIVIGAGATGCRWAHFIANNSAATFPALGLDTDPQTLVPWLTDESGLVKGLLVTPATSMQPNQDCPEEISISEGFNLIRPKVTEYIRSMDMVYLYAGLGGLTGTVLALKIAEMARHNKKDLVSFTSMPFQLEGSSIQQRARDYMQKVLSLSSVHIACNNENFMNAELYDRGLHSVFTRGNEVFAGITRVLNQNLAENENTDYQPKTRVKQDD